jgi:hypothetical protein
VDGDHLLRRTERLPDRGEARPAGTAVIGHRLTMFTLLFLAVLIGGFALGRFL